MRDRSAVESAEQREARLQQMRDRPADESAEQREARLQQMRDRLADESAEQREARLQQMRDRLADESAEQREARLQQMRDCLAAESAEQRKARLQHMRDRLADESVKQREVWLQQMSDSQRERMAAETIKLCYHFFIFIHSHRFNLINLSSPPPPETLQYIHLFIQLDSFTICTLVYIIITRLLLHLHFTITFRQTTNSACAHQLRLAPQYDMHITSYFVCSWGGETNIL